jgi:DNA-directed RNA polymerase I subunit RPA1
VSPNDRDSVCPTCGHKGLECSGHPGHIELIVPVYNPLVIDVLLKLLRMTCLHCHRFRIRHRIKEDYSVMLELIRRDKIALAYDFYDINTEEERRRLDKLEKEVPADGGKAEHEQRIQQCLTRIEQAQMIKEEFMAGNETTPSSTSIQLFSEFIKFLYGLTQKKCPYKECRKVSKQVKKEGANKIFLIDRDADEEEGRNVRKRSRDSTSRP